ncbi:hypothetical protein ROHU_012493 [Labeo rohita]|uniref:Uncharacterized protein n=1 Tax=Labeo rohita TaxID=84645 RepID=A0A498LCT9_LABRO|nr:hypothetical protein ROHU_012493 [Labeo rohita]
MSLCCMCGGPVDFPDAHEDCVLCLGRAHSEAALEGSDCKACEDLPIKILCARLSVARWTLCLPHLLPSSHRLADRRLESSREMVSLGYEEDDIMSTSASDPGAWSEVPSQASCTLTSLDVELMSILTEAVADLELDWAAPEQPSKR